jgi:hypothetical protein
VFEGSIGLRRKRSPLFFKQVFFGAVWWFSEQNGDIKEDGVIFGHVCKLENGVEAITHMRRKSACTIHFRQR